MGKSREPSNDDVSLFDDVYRDHSRIIYYYLLGRLGDDHIAQDLMQETFLRVWRHIGDLRDIPTEKRRFWLFAIAKNISSDYCRRKRVREVNQMEMPEMVASATISDPSLILEAKETASLVDAAIQHLPDYLRTVLAMHLEGEMTSTEIGRLLNLPAGTVRYQISEARRRIAGELGLSLAKHQMKRDIGE